MIVNKKMAAIALLATASLAGCGSNSSGENATAPAATPTIAASSGGTSSGSSSASGGAAKVSPADAQWAKSLCTAMKADVKSLAVPKVNGTSPASTKQSLSTLFTQLVEQVGNERKALEAAGPPPGSAATAQYHQVQAKLVALKSKVTAVQKKIEAATVKTSGQLASLEAELKGDLSILSGDPGPVAALSKGKALGAALAAEPACASLV